MKAFLVFVIVGMGVCTAVHAQSPDYSPQQKSCVDAAKGDGDKIDDCTRAELGRQEAQLAAAYRKLSSSLSPYRKGLLQQSQELWRQFRDAECDLERTRVIGGPLGIIQRAQATFRLECMEKQTHLRLVALEDDYDSQKYDPK